MRTARTRRAASVLAVLCVLLVSTPAAARVAPSAAPAAPGAPSPADGATGVARPPILDVTVTDPDGDAVDVTFYGRRAPAPPGEDFTIVAIPDTQHYAETASLNTIYTAQMNWIVSSRSALNTVFATHLGDLTQSFQNAEVEWQRASANQAILDANGVRNNVLPGNHDFANGGRSPDALFFDRYFPPSRYQGFPWYGGYLGDPDDGIADGGFDRGNKDNYELFSAGGMDFLVIHLEHDMPSYTTAWAQRVLDAYPARHTIISTHQFVDEFGNRTTSPESRLDGQSAQTVWTQLIAPNCQIFMVVNGHFHGEGRRTDPNSCGDPVFQLNSDYQEEQNGGDGWLRYYTFRPSLDRIEAYTYSPTRAGGAGQFQNDADSRFDLTWDMAAPDAFQAIGTASDVPSGGHASVPWTGLASGTGYQWYAVADDGTSTRTGPTWSFTTNVPAPTAPVVDAVTIDQATPGSADLLSVTVQAHDDNDDALVYRYRWFRNGSPIGGATAPTLDLAAPGAGDRGDTIAVEVTADDGTFSSAPRTSPAVTIVNAPPVASVVVSDEIPNTNDTLTATVTRSDADGDPVGLTYRWTVNGVLERTTTTAATSDALDLSVPGNGDGGDVVTVSVTPNDGSANGTVASASATVFPAAVPPLFAEDFASGTLDAWNGTAGIAIDAADGSPAPSARAQVANQPAYGRAILGGTYATVCLSADVRLTSGATSLFRLETATNTKILKVLVNAAGNLQLRSEVTDVGFNTRVALGTGWHAIEVCGTVGTSSTWDLYRDGALIADDWAVSTGTAPVGSLLIGETAERTATIAWDDVRLDRVVGDGRPTAPGQPAGSSPSAGTIRISWPAATSPFPPLTYRVYRDGGATPIGQTTATTFDDTGLTAGSSHTYRVDAVDQASQTSPLSAASAPVTVTSGGGGPIFADAFASGTFAAWTQVSGMTIDATRGSPAPSARAQVSGAKAFASRTLPATYAQVCLSANVNLQGGAAALLRLRTASGANLVKVAVTGAGKLQVRSDVSGTSLNAVALGTGWHLLELCGTVGTATRWDLYRDGVRVVNQWQANTGTTPVGRIVIGDTAAKTVTVNVDDVRLDQAPGG